MIRKYSGRVADGQMTFEDVLSARVAETQKPSMRKARANAILAFIEKINHANRGGGATGQFGETHYGFDFNSAYGTRVNRYGVKVIVR